MQPEGRTDLLTSPDVVPVRVSRRKLLEPCSLDNVNPLRKLHLHNHIEKFQCSEYKQAMQDGNQNKQ